MVRKLHILQQWLSGARGYVFILLVAAACAVILKAFILDAVVIPSLSMEQTLLKGDCILVNKFIYTTDARGGRTSAGAGFSPFRRVEPGDVVVFRFPEGRNKGENQGHPLFVKRCVATGGDEVVLRDGELKIDRQRWHEEPVDLESSTTHFVIPKRGDVIPLMATNIHFWNSFIEREGHTVAVSPDGNILVDGTPSTRYIVERNYLYVLGDNRDHSYDSRAWGFLPEENVVGKAMLVYWSVDPLGGIRWERIGSPVR